MNISDLLRQANAGAGGFNAGLARLADSVVGNPVAKAANTLGADVEANPLLRLMNEAGLGVRPERHAGAYDAGRMVGDVVGGFVPGAGDVDGIKQAADTIQAEGANTRTMLYAALAAAGLLPGVPQAARYVMDKMPGGHAPRVGDRFGANEKGMITYHGTPHQFEPTENNPLGEFDHSKMGSGEGAQAYGYGTYLAENRGVADSYRAMSDLGFPDGDNRQGIGKVLAMRGEDAAREMYGRVMPADQLEAAIKEAAQALNEKSHLYTVDLPDEHIANMLDWDAPLSEQPEVVRRFLEEMGVTASSPHGGNAYAQLSQKMGSDQAASEALRRNGIPGIKYLDGSSRSAGGGTRNFVAFNPEAAKILARNGSSGQ